MRSLSALVFVFAAGLGTAHSQEVTPLSLPVGKSFIVELPEPYSNLMVAEPLIADVLPFSPTSVYVIAKGPGVTTVSAYRKDKSAISLIDVTVGPDIESLKASIKAVLPSEERVSIQQANGSLILSGDVADTLALGRIVALAEAFAPDRVINLLGVRANQQVMLSVRFSEVQRSAAKSLRANLAFTAENGNVVGESGSLLANSGLNGIVDGLLNPLEGFGAIKILNGNVDLVLDALEEKGFVTTLAEPTLVAMSGDTASFLAGGEFPIPVAQAASSIGGSSGDGGAGAISVEFKEFGVSLAFTPTVLENGMINLVVAPEVSSIAPSTSISVGGLAIPGLKTRKAKTSVELRDGQTFAIAGLIRTDFEDSVRKLPGAANLPVIGALFRSSGYKNADTELVITVTPRLIRPLAEEDIVLPTDLVEAPTETDLFLFGRSIGETSAVPERTQTSSQETN
ncbi:type II and III secretion system protein family protein [Hyphomonas sp.]|uniref:type II and III secretion system protein family protein n=1 Tax=Hyphomonas sp. TaxID=87 RepID=UPI003340A2E0